MDEKRKPNRAAAGREATESIGRKAGLTSQDNSVMEGMLWR